MLNALTSRIVEALTKAKRPSHHRLRRLREQVADDAGLAMTDDANRHIAIGRQAERMPNPEARALGNRKAGVDIL